MARVALIQLQNNPKTLWFDPQDVQVQDGDRVIVKTERGTEYGLCSGTADVEESAIEQLKSPLKPVLRVATEDDVRIAEELRQKSADALPIFKQMAAESNPDMHPVMVEYLFDGEKAVFFFEAEERVDFRDLVRKLASEFKVRVDMRQIGVRDEARMVGGLGHCGQELCCKRLGGEFCPVSIRMAKEQDLSLNPTKISGVCGRLMCCLRYEFDAYKDFHSRAPKQGAKIDTPAGVAKVVDLNVPREMVTVKLEEDDKRVTFPLSAMDEAAEGARPTSIGDAFEEYANPDPFAGSAMLGMFDTASFTGQDQLGKPEAHHNAKRDEDEAAPKKSRRRRRRKGQQGQTQGASQKVQDASKQDGGKAESQQEGPARRSRRRRSTKVGAEGAQQGAGTQAAGTQVGAGPRPGQRSSSLSGAAAQAASRPQNGRAAAERQQASTHRKSRRRSHKTGAGNES